MFFQLVVIIKVELSELEPSSLLQIVRFADVKSGVNPIKIVSNNMHVFVIDFVLVPILGLLLFLH